MINTTQLLVALLLALMTSTEAARSSLRRSNYRSRGSVRGSSGKSRQLFTARNNQLTNDIDREGSISNMAEEIHTLLEQTLQSKEIDFSNKVSLTDNVSGIKIEKEDSNEQCSLQGKVMFTTHKIQGLDDATSFRSTDIELVKGSEDYEEITDSRGRLQGYKWNGVWKVTATVDAFQVDVRSQVDVNACGEPLDFTAFGGVAVNHTTIEATVRVDGELSKDLSRGDLQIESAEVLDQDINFDSIANLGGLNSQLPTLDYQSEIHSLVEFFFARKLEQPVVAVQADKFAEEQR